MLALLGCIVSDLIIVRSLNCPRPPRNKGTRARTIWIEPDSLQFEDAYTSSMQWWKSTPQYWNLSVLRKKGSERYGLEIAGRYWHSLDSAKKTGRAALPPEPQDRTLKRRSHMCKRSKNSCFVFIMFLLIILS